MKRDNADATDRYVSEGDEDDEVDDDDDEEDEADEEGEPEEEENGVKRESPAFQCALSYQMGATCRVVSQLGAVWFFRAMRLIHPSYSQPSQNARPKNRRRPPPPQSLSP